jgi:SAM-dependent methyltransferase
LKEQYERETIVQEKEMLQKGTRTIEKKGLQYIVENGNDVKRFKPWLGDAFSFLYDFIMENSIFPKKFGGDMSKHYEILSQELKDIRSKRILELATGSGSAVNFLEIDNQYTGTDISPGLLGKAVKSFRAAGFEGAEFYVTSADDLPFDDSTFSICLCILSLNFFNDIKRVFQEIKRVLVPGGVFVCCVPVPERNRLQSTIRGTLCSEEELAGICKEHGFRFVSIPVENGALLYFKALLK